MTPDPTGRPDAEPWWPALTTFLESWRSRDEVEGALVTGSHVIGTATPRSDLDVHLVLSEGTDWRERGNKRVGGYLVEYFANPPAQLERYMDEDLHANQRTTARMFSLGRIVFDRTGMVAQLCERAQEQFAKPFPGRPEDEIERMKYVLWDELDTLRDLLVEGSPGFKYVASIALQHLVATYAIFLRVEVPPPYRQHRLLSDASFRQRYQLPELPDGPFARALRDAVGETDPARLLRLHEQLTEQVLEAGGGFNIDGWRMRSKLV